MPSNRFNWFRWLLSSFNIAIVCFVFSLFCVHSLVLIQCTSTRSCRDTIAICLHALQIKMDSYLAVSALALSLSLCLQCSFLNIAFVIRNYYCESINVEHLHNRNNLVLCFCEIATKWQNQGYNLNFFWLVIFWKEKIFLLGKKSNFLKR